MNEGAPGSDGPATDPTELPAAVADRTEGSALNGMSCFAIGVLSAVLGLLPWLLTGMRLPLQELWATPTQPEAMPVALLPLSQYAVTLIPGLFGTGAAAAGLLLRATRSRQPRRGATLLALGLLSVDAVAGVQATAVVADGLESSAEADLYLFAVSCVVLVSLGIAVAILLLTGRAPVPGATIGFVIGALAAGICLNALITPFGSPVPTDEASFAFRQAASALARWVPAVLAGLALGWCGLRTAGRVLAVLGGLLLLWVGPVATTAVSAATGTRILLQYPAEMLHYGLGVFRMAIGMPELVVQPMVVAIVVATVWMLVRRLTLRRRA